MRSADSLSRSDATDIVQRIVDVMYFDDDEKGDFYNPDKPLEGADFIDSAATILREYGLVPERSQRLD